MIGFYLFQFSYHIHPIAGVYTEIWEEMARP